MKKKIRWINILVVSIILLFAVNIQDVYAASNPYPATQDVDGDGRYEIPCTRFAWQQVYDNLGVALPAWGNAVNWWQSAINAGYATGSAPRAGAVAVWSGDTYGHVAYVTSGSGNTFVVNEGGRTDLDHTSSHGVAYGYKLTNAVGASRPYDTNKKLLGFIYPKTVHSHSYTSRITKQPTCTQAGVKTYTCSCGASYTETVKATGHKYTAQIVAPTMTEKGYTIHTCSVCNNTYKDNYVDSPKLESDGWHYCDMLPAGISSDKYAIQYRGYYEKIQASSPGVEWQNAGIVKDEWKNSGSTYTSATDLQVSNSRVLVRSVYYHFCGPNAGDVGNYAQTGNFVHYDEVLASSVTAKYLGTDNGYPYYFIYRKNSSEPIWCKSGETCDGSYGTHGNRCRAWYKMNTYQNKVRVIQYKFTKNSDWTDKKDASATSVQVRFKSLESETPEEPETPKDPEKPETPKDPEIPETPKDPEIPEKPETPNKPGNSVIPSIPDISVMPVEDLPQIGTPVLSSQCRYKIISEKEVAFVGTKNKKKTSVCIPATIKYNGKTYRVTSISKNAFYKNKRLKKIIIKSPYLKNIGKNSIKGIYKKAVIKCPKKQFKVYKRMFGRKTGYKKSMKIKR